MDHGTETTRRERGGFDAPVGQAVLVSESDERDAGKVEAYIPLPDDPRYSRVAAREGFEDIAVAYDRARPGYPAAMFDALEADCALRASDRILEVGCGTGQATRSLAAREFEITCVELGESLASLARENLARHTNVIVEVGSFEDAELGSQAFDLVFSATAFHWVDPHVGYPKAARVLRPSGHLALVTNAHVAGGTQDQIADDVQDLHRRIAPEVGPWQFATVADVRARATTTDDIAELWSRVDRSFVTPPRVAHLFERPKLSLFPWTADYDRDGYLAMLATQSIYVLMEPARRAELFAGMGDVIDDCLDGRITKQYLAILATARRRV
jgi:SAM-dependent methyltransferase